MKTIAILDFGGQYTHLIATRIRSLGVKAEIFPAETFCPGDLVDLAVDLAGMVFSGSPHSVCEASGPTISFRPEDSPVPILGLCYGHQLLAKLLGGEVARGKAREYGPMTISVDSETPVFSGLPSQQLVWMSHGDVVSVLPPGAREIARSPEVPNAGFLAGNGRFIGLQFHPEVAHTRYGEGILDRFLSLCTTDRPWQPQAFHREIVESVRKEAGSSRLLLLLSGGVDSLVALKLCLEAVGAERVFPVHVDNGLMRLHESAEIIRHLSAEGFHGIRLVNAEERFLRELSGVADPERKRGIIGRLFVEIVDESLRSLNLGPDFMLVQGTIYPDRIESGGSGRADKIKTHHNRVPEIERMIAAGRVIEPLGNLYKDEVRRLGRELGLPASLVDRHPFPGPGLGIRVLCSEMAASAAEPFSEEAEIKQFLAEKKLDGFILPVKSVGVQGDSRTYLHPVVIWGRETSPPDFTCLLEVARNLINKFPAINRVVWSLRPLDEGVLRQRAFVTKDRLDGLREIDARVREKAHHFRDIWQMPVVSLPAALPGGGGVFVIRPISSRDAMTAEVFPLPTPLFLELETELRQECHIGALLYDLTSKPPGTIEWE
jgi:GMP synthase (glutamine-hydrolysing)